MLIGLRSSEQPAPSPLQIAMPFQRILKGAGHFHLPRARWPCQASPESSRRGQRPSLAQGAKSLTRRLIVGCTTCWIFCVPHSEIISIRLKACNGRPGRESLPPNLIARRKEKEEDTPFPAAGCTQALEMRDGRAPAWEGGRRCQSKICRIAESLVLMRSKS
jgi:hypothetical protein